jgi:ADP-ribosylation factor-like protein 1
METLELSAISDRQWNIQACSALTKDGLNEGMEWMIQTINAKNQAQNSGAPAR